MTARILIAGGYGLVGSTIARHVRSISKETEFILAGRQPEKGTALARELGSARTAYLDLNEAVAFAEFVPVDLVVSALYDPANALAEAALNHGAAHISITTKAEDVGPIVAATLRSPPRRPIALLGHSMAGAAMIVAQKAAQQFRHVDSVQVTALFDVRDIVGPMTASDADMLIGRALLRESGKWAWVDGTRHPRTIRLSDEIDLLGHPTALLDVPSLAAITGAANVRFDIAQGDSLGTRRGSHPSSDVYIDIDGILKSGAAAKRRTILCDPNGLVHLTALGVLVATEHVLGLSGRTPPPGGLYLPETLVPMDAAIAQLEQFGVQIAEEDRAAEQSRPAV